MKRTLPLLVIGVVMLTLTACTNGPTTAATVDRDRIPESEVQRGVKALASSQLYRDAINAQLSASPDSVKLAPDASSAPASVSRQWLTTLIQSSVLRQLAQRRGVKATAEDLRTAHAELTGSQAQTQQEQQSAALFRSLPVWVQKQIAQSLGLQIALRRAIPQPVVTAAELRAAYQQLAADCPTKRLVGHILAGTEQEAKDVVSQIQKGDSFANVAAQVSTDSGSRTQAGLLVCEGSSQWSQLDATFRAVAEATPTGELSAPVQTQFGWHVIEVVDLTTEHAAPLLLAQAQAKQSDSLSTAVLAALKKANLWVNPRYGTLQRSDNGGFQIVSSAVTPRSRPSSTPSTTVPAGATAGSGTTSSGSSGSTTAPTSSP